MANSDFRVTNVQDISRLVSITSSDKDTYVMGLEKLCQKIIHALFTRTGEDPYDTDYGCQLIAIFKTSPLPKNAPQVERAVSSAVAKAQADVIRIQNNNRTNKVKNPEAFLRRLELISVVANLERYAWEINIRVYSESGESTELFIPIEN